MNLDAELTGPMFEQLRDSEQFRQAFLDPELHIVCWPNGADFAPEFLKSLILARQLVDTAKS